MLAFAIAKRNQTTTIINRYYFLMYIKYKK